MTCRVPAQTPRPAIPVLVVILVTVAAAIAPPPSADAQASAPVAADALDVADARGLDRLFADGLFDPAGRRFVAFKLPVRDVWTGVREREVYGWLVEPAAGAGAAAAKDPGDGRWTLLETGEAVPVMSDVTPADLAKRCESIMAASRERAVARQRRAAVAATRPAATTAPTRAELRRRAMSRGADDGDDGADEDGPTLWLGHTGHRFAAARPAAYLAAWLRRAARDDAAAARMLALARAEPAPIAAGPDSGRAATVPVTRPAVAATSAATPKTVPELAATTGPIPRRGDPWHWFSSAVHAYMVRSDAEALFYLRRMAEYHPAALTPPPPPKKGDPGGRREERAYPQARTLLAELERRQKEGTFHATAPAPVAAAVAGRDAEGQFKVPAEFAAWPADRRVAYLIDQLQDVDARQNGQPGGVDLGSDPRVAALIEAGDVAVPALIDCVERDERLTRSVHFWRDFSNDRTVLGVREAALTAVMSILRTSVFEPAATGDNFTSRGEETAKRTAERLRAYWKTYGTVPFDERMMAVLTDAKARPEAWREAADNLANLGGKRTIGTTVWSGRAKEREPGTGNPAVGKFKDPTVAEAILAAMDRDLARHDGGKRDPRMHDYYRRRIESQYVDALIELKDRAVVPALLKRLENPPSLRERRLLAVACFALGDARPLTGFAADVRDGNVTIPDVREPNTNDNEQPAAVEMSGIVGTLARASQAVPAADAALWALADPAHPLHALAARGVRSTGYGFEGRVWTAHPFCLGILRADLDDVRPTGKTYWVERDEEGTGERLAYKEERGSGSGGLPPLLADLANRRDRADARACDAAAERISAMVLGVRPCHPLLKDADARLAELRAFLDAHLTHLRPAAYAEAEVLGGHGFGEAKYVLNVRVVGPATADDVRAGAAIFHLGGKGTSLADLKLPASAVLKRDRPPAREPVPADVAAGRAREYYQSGGAPGDEPRRVIKWDVPRVLVLQAERGQDGAVYYGVVSADGTRRVAADEVAEVKPLGGE